MVSSKQNGCPNHYNGPPNPRNYALLGAVGDTYSQTNRKEKPSSQSTGCPPTHCEYLSPNTTPCNALIDCTSAPEHLRAVHDVRDISRSDHITCAWTGCGQSMLRNNFIRHVREVHLRHDRNFGH